MINSIIRVKEIWLSRAEGRTDECIEKTVDSFEAADSVLRRWARTAPKQGGYHKCDFKITFVDGETYDGRYDLYGIGVDTDEGTRGPSLSKHVRDFVTFYAGQRKPAHLSHEQYAQCLSWARERNPEATVEMMAFLENYDLGGG